MRERMVVDERGDDARRSVRASGREPYVSIISPRGAISSIPPVQFRSHDHFHDERYVFLPTWAHAS